MWSAQEIQARYQPAICWLDLENHSNYPLLSFTWKDLRIARTYGISERLQWLRWINPWRSCQDRRRYSIWLHWWPRSAVRITECYMVENRNEVLIPLLRLLDSKKPNIKAPKSYHLKILECLQVLPTWSLRFWTHYCGSFLDQNDRKFHFVTANTALLFPRFLMVSELE